MAGPRISEQYRYMTLPQAAKYLEIHPSKLRRRLRDGVFPPPTYINEHGLKFFDKAWLKKVKGVLKNSFENKEKPYLEGRNHAK